MKEDIINESRAKKVVNKLKPYMDPITGYIIHPVDTHAKYCKKYEDRWPPKKGGS